MGIKKKEDPVRHLEDPIYCILLPSGRSFSYSSKYSVDFYFCLLFNYGSTFFRSKKRKKKIIRRSHSSQMSWTRHLKPAAISLKVI